MTTIPEMLQRPGYVSTVMMDLLPPSLHAYSEPITAVCIVVAWIAIAVTIVKYSKRVSGISTTHKEVSPAKTKTQTPTKEIIEEETPSTFEPEFDPVVATEEVKEEPVEETTAKRSVRRSRPKLEVSSESMMTTRRSVKTPERFSPWGKVLDTDQALRPSSSRSAGRSSVAKSIKF